MSIKNIIIDCDGVLTDGKKYVDETGKRLMIAFHSRDDTAITQLIHLGYSVIIFTSSDFPGIRAYWGRKGVMVVNSKDKRKDLSINWSETLGIGDDEPDFDFLSRCAESYVVSDASPNMLAKFPTLKTKGGCGVMAEVFRRLTISYSVNEKSTVA